jgi:hypothetical protein
MPPKKSSVKSEKAKSSVKSEKAKSSVKSEKQKYIIFAPLIKCNEENNIIVVKEHYGAYGLYSVGVPSLTEDEDELKKLFVNAFNTMYENPNNNNTKFTLSDISNIDCKPIPNMDHLKMCMVVLSGKTGCLREQLDLPVEKKSDSTPGVLNKFKYGYKLIPQSRLDNLESYNKEDIIFKKAFINFIGENVDMFSKYMKTM